MLKIIQSQIITAKSMIDILHTYKIFNVCLKDKYQ